jgi:hypothetical protein
MSDYQIKKAREVTPYDSVVIAGPPGTGKSTVAGSAAAYEEDTPLLLLATLPREVKSWQYQLHNVDYLVVSDPDWQPTLGKLAATGFKQLREIIEALKDDDEYRTIVIDSGTECAEMAWHYSLSPHGVASPAFMEAQDGEKGPSRWLPYETLDIHMTEIVLSAVALTLPDLTKMPKNVIFTWHIRPSREDTVGSKKSSQKSADKTGKDIEYEGAILPQVRGQFRRRLMQYVSAYVYTHQEIKITDHLSGEQSVKYYLQVRPDNERHTKVPGPVPTEKYVPADWKALKQFLTQQKELEMKAALEPQPVKTLEAATEAVETGLAAVKSKRKKAVDL